MRWTRGLFVGVMIEIMISKLQRHPRARRSVASGVRARLLQENDFDNKSVSHRRL